MKKYITGLSMAWGNFFWIPCPIRKWDNDARNYMLSWLPTIGAMIGGLWLLLYVLLVRLNCPVVFATFLMTFAPFLLSGFIHVDGFMDVSDAIGSWGTKEKKQQILKDSHVGSGAVIRILFYILCYYSALRVTVPKGFVAWHLVIIPIIPRAVSTLFVYFSKKIGEDTPEGVKSQYVNLKKEGFIFLLIQLCLYIALVYVFSAYYIENTALILSLLLGTVIPILIAKKRLYGMNGDIAGFGILFGELMGLVSLVFMTL